ncbi:hypothetical protein [Micromonospora sp. DT233]|uniref:hypothetical protein n=1 Tax=Micromonospora sp. DT233 TaxID=3393432 RepID=UPI003CF32CB5
MNYGQLRALAESLGEPVPAPVQPIWKSKIVAAVVGGVLLFGAGVGVGALIFRPAGDGAGEEKGKSSLVLAKEKCLLGSGDARVGDGGKSLILDGGGEEDSGLTSMDIRCVLEELKTPDHVVSEMSSTRALDGKQAAQWGKIRASWTYHPDQGLDLILVSD